MSEDGQTVVLVDAGPDPDCRGQPFRDPLPDLRQATPKIVQLNGSFEYDALSPDGARLYVVEHLAGPPDGHYQVRAIDTATGTLRDGVVVDKPNLDEPMAGYPIAQLRRPNGFVFTLYRGAQHPFIHALSSADGWALCIDLPAAGSDDPSAALDWGLTDSPDGRVLFAVNATLGLAVEVDSNDLSVRRTAQFEAPASAAISLAKFGHEEGGPVGRRVVASADGSTLYAAGSGGIVRIAATDLTMTGTFLEGSAIDALALTPDGETLYALVRQGGRIVELDTASGDVIGQVPGDGYDRLVAIVPWWPAARARSALGLPADRPDASPVDRLMRLSAIDATLRSTGSYDRAVHGDAPMTRSRIAAAVVLVLVVGVGGYVAYDQILRGDSIAPLALPSPGADASRRSRRGRSAREPGFRRHPRTRRRAPPATSPAPGR